MLRKVELFIHKGRVLQKASLSEGSVDYGRIQILNSLDEADQNNVEAYTHYRHSFLKDEKNNPIQPDVNDDVPVYCFLIPMEYLFEEFPGDPNDTPLLAVNVSTTFPYLEGINPNAKNRHPCTTSTTIAPDQPGTEPSGAEVSFLMLPVLFIGSFLNKLFHRNKKYFYGINDYGELTVIETNNKEDATKLKPWTKIILENPNTKHHALFSRVYSPKRKKEKRDEFKILKQKFNRIDEEWVWKFKDLQTPKY